MHLQVGNEVLASDRVYQFILTDCGFSLPNVLDAAPPPAHPGRSDAALTPFTLMLPVPPSQGVPTLPELKLRYYELLVRYYSHSHNYLEMTRCYRAMYETESIAADMDKWAPVSPWEGRGLGFRV